MRLKPPFYFPNVCLFSKYCVLFRLLGRSLRFGRVAQSNDQTMVACSVAHSTNAARPRDQTYSPIEVSEEDPSRVSQKHLAQERGGVLTGAVGAGCSRRQAR